MREILFRGKSNLDEIWYYGYLVMKKCEDGAFPFIVGTDGGKCDVIPETVGQYTGLTDRYGNKIFEGDMVKSCNMFGQNFIAKVTYNEALAEFVLGVYLLEDLKGISDLEKIGNIHDNPELLVEGKKYCRNGGNE